MLVDYNTWSKIHEKSKITEFLKYMPEKLEVGPLQLRFKLLEIHRAKYEDWLRDYNDYLIDIFL